MADKKQASILIVDDEPEIREVLQNILIRKYDVVDTAKNGMEALEMISEKNYDLLLVDLNMPKMTGQELAKTIRERGDHHTSIIILTGHGTFKDAHEMLKDAGISDFLNKPADRGRLLFAVKRALREHNLTHHLEELVLDRTAELRASQTMLIQAEKMASLGRLVAGVAHEVNTPIGTALLGISHLGDKERAFSSSLNAGGITRQELGTFLDTIRETVQESKAALGDANRLILNFKQLAIDQAGESRREFVLAANIESVLSSLQIHKTEGIKTEVDCPDHIVLDSFPGQLGQVLTNLVQNSLMHGFEGKPSGVIGIKAEKEGETVTIHYHDDGIGMKADTVKKVFDPFYTTKINQGGNGIGMSISFNLVTELLGGTIECRSKPGEGASFIINLPVSAARKE